MRTTRLWIAFAVLLGLSVYIGYEVYTGGKKTRREELEKRLVPWPKEDVVELLIQKKDQTIRLTREDGKWRITEPGSYEADQDEVKYLVGRLTEFKYQRKLEEPKEEYGFSEPQFQVTVRRKDGTALEFRIGEKTPVGFGVYVQKGEEAFVFDEGLLRELDKDLKDFRNRNLYQFRTPDAVGIILKKKGEPVLRVRKEEERWWIEGEPRLPARKTRVEGWLRNLEFLRVEDFLEASVDPANLGLQPPEYEIEVTFRKDGQEQTSVAEFGKSEDKKWYARRKGSPEIGYLPTERQDDVLKERDALLLKAIADFDEFDVTRIEVQEKDLKYAIAKRLRGGIQRWVQEKKEGSEIPFAEVTRLFDLILNTDFPDLLFLDEKGPSTYGMDQPVIRLTFQDEDGGTLAIVLFAQKGKDYYAMEQGMPFVRRVPETEFRKLLQILKVFREGPPEAEPGD